MAEIVTVSVWVGGLCDQQHYVTKEVTVRAAKGSSGNAAGTMACPNCTRPTSLYGSYTA